MSPCRPRSRPYSALGTGAFEAILAKLAADPAPRARSGVRRGLEGHGEVVAVVAGPVRHSPGRQAALHFPHSHRWVAKRPEAAPDAAARWPCRARRRAAPCRAGPLGHWRLRPAAAAPPRPAPASVAIHDDARPYIRRQAPLPASGPPVWHRHMCPRLLWGPAATCPTTAPQRTPRSLMARSPHADQGTRPVWNERFIFSNVSPYDQEVVVSVSLPGLALALEAGGWGCACGNMWAGLCLKGSSAPAAASSALSCRGGRPPCLGCCCAAGLVSWGGERAGWLRRRAGRVDSGGCWQPAAEACSPEASSERPAAQRRLAAHSREQPHQRSAASCAAQAHQQQLQLACPHPPAPTAKCPARRSTTGTSSPRMTTSARRASASLL